MKRIFASLLAFAVLGAPNASCAQVESFFERNEPFAKKNPKDKDGHPDGNNGWGNNGPTDVPFDGGVGVLLAAGAAYGVKKYRAEKRAQP